MADRKNAWNYLFCVGPRNQTLEYIRSISAKEKRSPRKNKSQQRYTEDTMKTTRILF